MLLFTTCGIMGEYWVSHKRMNEDNSRIKEVRAMTVTGKTLNPPLNYSRKDVIESIEKNNGWFTCQSKDKNTWTKKAEIHVIQVENEKFIRTDRDTTPSDNLGELPVF